MGMSFPCDVSRLAKYGSLPGGMSFKSFELDLSTATGLYSNISRVFITEVRGVEAGSIFVGANNVSAGRDV